MTNAEKLAKELLENLDDFAKLLVNGMCPLYQHCSDCPLFYVKCNRDEIKEWLEQEVDG